MILPYSAEVRSRHTGPKEATPRESARGEAGQRSFRALVPDSMSCVMVSLALVLLDSI